MPCSRPFDLWDEDSLLFDSRPELFVRLDEERLIWSVRGIALFSPRFRQIGIDISTVTTAARFAAALERWLAVEWHLLEAKVCARADEDASDAASQFLKAIIKGDDRLAQAWLAQLETSTEPSQ